MSNQYDVYILTNQRHTVLYIGVTSDLAGRVWEHNKKVLNGFTQKYNANKLIYFETFDNPTDAIAREKQLKGWSRKKKEGLINTLNSEWKDIYEDII